MSKARSFKKFPAPPDPEVEMPTRLPDRDSVASEATPQVDTEKTPVVIVNPVDLADLLKGVLNERDEDIRAQKEALNQQEEKKKMAYLKQYTDVSDKLKAYNVVAAKKPDTSGLFSLNKEKNGYAIKIAEEKNIDTLKVVQFLLENYDPINQKGAKDAKWLGELVVDWIEDVKNRIAVLEMTPEKKKALEDLKTKMEAELTNNDRRDLLEKEAALLLA